MAATVKILIEGYTNADSVGETGEEKTQPTITLIKDKDVVMVVDPGLLDSQKQLVDELEKENLSLEDITVVCVTHSHIDHYRNIGIFPNAKVLEFFGLWDKNTVQNWKEQFSTNIQIVKTPGHDYTGLTVFATTKNGVVAVCGDVFWKKNYPADPADDSYASDPVKLKESREMVLKMADWVVPGHGPMFSSEKEKILEKENKDNQNRYKESKNGLVCKICHKPMKQEERCTCRPYLCFRCCECGIDCDLCVCSHKKRK